MTDLHREMGEHDARLATLEREMSECRRDVRSILDFISQAKGGWRTVAMLAGIAGAVGGAVGYVLKALGKG